MILSDEDIDRARQVEELTRWKSTHAPRIVALEALLEEAQLKADRGAEAIATLESERQANAMLTAEVERLSGSEAGLNKYIAKIQADHAALQAKLYALEHQEPVAWRYEIEDGVYRYCRHRADTDMVTEFGELNPVALYAAPVPAQPKQPLTDEQLLEGCISVRKLHKNTGNKRT